MSTPPTKDSHVGKRTQPVVTVRMADWAFPTSAAALVAGLVPGLSNPPARAPQGSTRTTSGDGITPRHIGSVSTGGVKIRRTFGERGALPPRNCAILQGDDA